MTQGLLAVTILLSSIVLFILAYNLPRIRGILMAIGFYMVMTGIFASYSNWLPQTRGEVPPPPPKMEAGAVDTMPVDKLAEMGEAVIFGKVGGFAERGIGPGQCPLCHTFKAGDIGDRAPNLIGIAKRAAERIKDPKYLKPDTVQVESFKGSGRATTAEEYIAESHVCPACYVVSGFGTKGTNDKDSPMPAVHKPPISLTIEQLIAVDTWLFFREGETPPSAKEIRAAYEKFIPESDRPKGGAPAATQVAAPAGPPIVVASDTPDQIATKMGCFACHQIPGIATAKFGVIGPLLIEGHNAARRIASPEYQAQVKAGKAHAKTPKEYVMESIVNPNAFIVPQFVQKANPTVSPMIQDFAQKFTYGALEKMADYLLAQDCDQAKKDGLNGPPQESFATVCGGGGGKAASK
ncbi:MAG: nitric oxide reductase [Nitrospirae bacterium]|nr:nitric oxide reductase [Nitrospirota bacterium]